MLYKPFENETRTSMWDNLFLNKTFLAMYLVDFLFLIFLTLKVVSLNVQNTLLLIKYAALTLKFFPNYYLSNFFLPFQVEIPRAFVCAESKIFDVSEWASCQVGFPPFL